MRHFLHHSPILAMKHSGNRLEEKEKLYTQHNTTWKEKLILMFKVGDSESVPLTYPNIIGNTSGADHIVRMQPATDWLVDKGAMARPFISSQLPSFHPCPPGRPSEPVHVLQRRSGRGRGSS